MKFVPVTVSVKPASPANAALGPSDATAGVGLLTVKVSAPDTPPPGAGVETETWAVPAVAMSAAVMAACRLVPETKVVARALPFHSTLEDDMKFAPVTVSVKPAPPATTELGFTEPIARDGLGLGGAGGGGVLLPPPHPTRHTKATVYNVALTARPARSRSPNPAHMPSLVGLEDTVSLFMTPSHVAARYATFLTRASDK
jgi:hypothetical protein